MTTRHLVETTADAIEEAAFNTGREIVRDTAEQRMYLTLDGITFWAPSPELTDGPDALAEACRTAVGS